MARIFSWDGFFRSNHSGTMLISFVAAVIGVGTILNPALADETRRETAETDKPSRLMARVQYYFDERDFNTLEIMVASDRLPLGLKFFGFTDLHGTENDADHRFDTTRSFSEYRLYHTGLGELIGLPGLGLMVEYNDFTPGSADLLRAGLLYKHGLSLPWLKSVGKQKGWLMWRAFPIESDGNGGQASLIWNLPIHERIGFSGFADLNVIEGSHDRWVVEPQLNFRLYKNIWGVIEYRYNGFEDANSVLKGEGFAPGIRIDL